MSGGFVPGSLVVVHGLKEKAKGEGSEVVDLNGAKGQLIEWRADLDIWIATTLSGRMIGVGQKYLRLIKADELGSCDLVLGPKSDPKQLAKNIAEVLAEKGYLSMTVILGDSYREEIFEELKGLELQGGLNRLPKGFEQGHLGEGGKGKVLQLEAGMIPEGLAATQLPKQDENLSMMSDLLRKPLKTELGIAIHSRTPTLLRLPFADIDDESKYLPTAASAAEADQFLEIMGRRQVGVLHFLGPESGTLTLQPRRDGVPEVTITAAPNTMVMFLAEQYNHKLVTSGDALTLSSYYLEAPRSYQVLTSAPTLSTEGGGGMLAFLGNGPAGPRGMERVKVIGIASRDPCNASEEDHFWYSLRHAGCDGFLCIPQTRFDVEEKVDWGDMNRAMMSGKSYCRHQGHIEGIECFDEKFFNIQKTEVYGMDPEQRIICEVGWNCLKSAGYDANILRRDAAHIGMYVGISTSDWTGLNVEQNLKAKEQYDKDGDDSMFIPGSPNGQPETFIANRFSFIFNLKGPSFISNTACSASLVAGNAAKLHLLNPFDPLEACVCAGISLNTGLGTWIGNCAGGMLSFKGRSFSFMDGADGYGRGEGAASCVIARGGLDDENCLVLMAGSHANSDGRSASLTAPNGPAQQRLLKAILEEVRVNITEISTYEAHGTGTMLGDPIEIGAVIKVLGKGRKNALCISCSKTNIGHLEGGAGMSGFAKCVLGVMHAECAPNQHTNLINPNLNIDTFQGNFISEGISYGLTHNYVGVSGFGYGGTNAHCMAYGRRREKERSQEAATEGSAVTFRRIQTAAAPVIEMDSENFEAWTTTGVPHLTAKDGDRFHVELKRSGQAIWRELVEPEVIVDQMTPFIQGSFNDNGADMLDSTDVDGLYSCEVTLGSSGEETFTIILDADPDLCFFPDEKSCTQKSKPMAGPEVPPSAEHVWVIKGKADDTYRVEFFLSGVTKSVSWVKVQNEE